MASLPIDESPENVPPIGKTSVAESVTRLLDVSLCLPCLVQRTGLPGAEVSGMLHTLAHTIQLVQRGRCAACLQETPIFCLSKPSTVNGAAASVPAPTRLSTDLAALWRFLSDHRGQKFCTACLAEGIGASGRIDRVLIAAEGRGARRVYGDCAICGRSRLLSGLQIR